MGPKVIIVGGGLAGLSAAHTVLERGGRALVLDKKDFLGGNSVKATSGINGTPTSTQALKKIPDNAHVFYEDTALSAAGGKKNLVNGKLPEMPTTFPLVKVLANQSGPAVEWLMDAFQLDLSLVSQLGGHSHPRTHRGKERFPGMTITYALMEKFDDLAREDATKARVVPNAVVDKLIQEADGTVVGVEYSTNGERFKEYGPVIIATGGFCADFGADSLLAKYRPDLLNLPTTNGDHCTGDGIKLSMGAGGATVDMTSVQVHPTGLVHPAEPDNKVKFLAAEALRGVGGLLLNNKGQRFADELGTRDYVTGEMWANKSAPYRLVLNSKGSNEILWHCKHYVGRGLMKHFKSGAEMAKEMGISAAELKKTFDKYNEGAKTKKDEFGKKFHHNMPFVMDDEYHVAIVTPVVHYSMGGIQINPASEVVRENADKTKFGDAIKGLFAAGEVAGGVHGKNRLGGSGLLGCVVYGRVAGDSATRYLLQHLTTTSGAAPGVASTDAAVNRRVGGLLNQLQPGTFSITVNPAQNSFTVQLPGGQGGDAQFGFTGVGEQGQQQQQQHGAQQGHMNVSPSGAVAGQQSVVQGHVVQQGAQPLEKGAQPAKQGTSQAQVGTSPGAGKKAGVPAVAQNAEKKEYTYDEVAKHNTEKDCWCVVNGDVLDVTKFMDKHPGGKHAILLFAGKEASDEFNMIHKKDVVMKYAPETIVGRIKK